MTITAITSNYLLILSPIYLTSIVLMFILSKKWAYDRILLASVVSSTFCLFAFSMGHTALAIITICSSQTILVIYSMFFRRRNDI